MNKAKILVVDDNKDLTTVIVARLQKHGLNAEAVNSGKEALEYASKNTPDLIILDLLMPEMDGYEVSNRLRAEKNTANIPIIMLTAKDSQKDKVKALKMGIDDYITKPYNSEELTARIEAVLRRSKRAAAEPEAKGVSVEDKKRLDFLKYLIEKDVRKIEPEYNMSSQNGYGYKIAADFFEKKDGSELEDLKYIAEKQVFKKDFFDKILLCPYCFHHDINVRETCPSNHSADITVAEMIHHYQCGYVGTEAEYMEGIKYVCPKCRKELKHIGVDYDKPGRTYVCNSTGEKFTEPDIYCQCRSCKKFFEADDAVRQDIYTFAVMDRINEVATQGRFTEMNLELELIDQDVDVYNMRYFRTKFSEELKRCQTFKRSLTLILVSIANFDDILQAKGETTSKGLLKDLTRILKENLWSVDIPARYEKNSFINLLPEADKKRAKKIIAMIKEKTTSLTNEGLEIIIKTVSFPEDADNEETLLEKLVKSRPV